MKKYSRPPLLEEPFAQTLSQIKTQASYYAAKKEVYKEWKNGLKYVQNQNSRVFSTKGHHSISVSENNQYRTTDNI